MKIKQVHLKIFSINSNANQYRHLFSVLFSSLNSDVFDLDLILLVCSDHLKESNKFVLLHSNCSIHRKEQAEVMRDSNEYRSTTMFRGRQGARHQSFVKRKKMNDTELARDKSDKIIKSLSLFLCLICNQDKQEAKGFPSVHKNESLLAFLFFFRVLLHLSLNQSQKMLNRNKVSLQE